MQCSEEDRAVRQVLLEAHIAGDGPLRPRTVWSLVLALHAEHWTDWRPRTALDVIPALCRTGAIRVPGGGYVVSRHADDGARAAAVRRACELGVWA